MQGIGSIKFALRDHAWIIERADPRILVAAWMVDEAKADGSFFVDNVRYGLDGDLFRIEAANRTLIYRIGEKATTMLAYYAEWPD